ncbi:MAG: hypothetical protein PVH61_17510 [Candidatus Aminicenantes bacterium]|jgi:hypothetical protein
MTYEATFNQKFLRGSRGQFFQKAPPVLHGAEGKEVRNDGFKKLAMAAAKGLAGD